MKKFICKIFGHWWGEPKEEWKDFKIHRKYFCKTCGILLRHDEHWID